MKLNEKLRALRKEHGFTQEELAEKMNVSRQSVYKWESGASTPEIQKILLLCDFFEISTDDLLRNNNTSYIDPSLQEDQEGSSQSAESNKVNKQWKKLGIGLISFMLLIILGGILWWQFQSPVPSGLYVERESAYHFIEKDGVFHMDFVIPVVWVRSTPFDRDTSINEVTLIDDEGDEVFMVEGEYNFQPVFEEDRRFNRVVRGKIEVPLNARRTLENGGTSSAPLNELKEEYRFDALNLTYKGEALEFSLEERYEVKIIEPQPSPGSDAGEMLGFSPKYDEDDVLIGFIYELERVRDHELTKVHYWLPGMDEGYFDLLRIEGNQTMDKYQNDFEGFKGDILSMPHRIDSSRILVYFPITEEIKEKAAKSILKIMPYFEMKKPDGEAYFIGGGGQWGPFPRNTPWHEMVIEGNPE